MDHATDGEPRTPRRQVGAAMLIVLLCGYSACRSSTSSTPPPTPQPSKTLASCLTGDGEACVAVNLALSPFDVDMSAMLRQLFAACDDEHADGCALALQWTDIRVQQWRVDCDQFAILYIEGRPEPSHPLVDACEQWVEQTLSAIGAFDDERANAHAVMSKRCKEGDALACIPPALHDWHDRDTIEEKRRLCREKPYRNHWRCAVGYAPDDAAEDYERFVTAQNRARCASGIPWACERRSKEHEQSVAVAERACTAGDWIFCMHVVRSTQLDYRTPIGPSAKQSWQRAKALSPLVDDSWRQTVDRLGTR